MGTAVVAMFAFLAASLLRTSNMTIVDILGWQAYAFFQGATLTGWWVLAHECGHGGFSASQFVNDCVGLVLHSVLLVPYYSWQYSHAKHHAKTNHLMDGETHNPNTQAEIEEAGYVALFHAIGEEGFAGFQLFAHLVVGWPAYLVTNATGARRLYNHKPIEDNTLDHFRPWSKLFPPNWERRIYVGTTCWIACFTAIWAATYKFGFVPVACFYWGPYLWVNFWLVLYHIGSTHVCHHLFSNLPCYHAVEATKHLKAYLKPLGLYNYDHDPVVTSMWKAAKECQYVEGTDGIHFPKAVRDLKKD